MKRTIKWQNKDTEGETVNFKLISPEQWNEYQLADGTILRVKTILGTIMRLTEHNPDGDPIYVINTQNHVVAAFVPEELRKK